MARPRKNGLSDVKAPSKKPDIEVVCMKCGETKKANRDFYMSYNSKVNIAPFCKKCVIENSLDEYENISKERFVNVLQQLDRPFLNQIYNKNFISYSEDSARFVGFYMKDISLKDYRELTFTDSDVGYVEELTNNATDLEDMLDSKEKERLARERIDKASKNSKLSVKRREELIDKFGRFDDDTLNRFETRYQKMAKGYQIHTALHQEALITYCKFSVLQDIAIESNNTTEAKMYGDLATKARMDAKLNPNQINLKDMQVGGVDSFAQISELLAKRDGLINIPMLYLKKPQDILDYQLMENVNYMRASFNMPELTYEDINKTYLDRIEKFNERYDADIMNNDFGTWGD